MARADATGTRPRVYTPTSMVVLAIAYMALVTQLPFALTLYFSLHRWNLMHPEWGFRFVGLTNFALVLSSRETYVAVVNTLVLTPLTVIGAVAFGLLLGILMDEPLPFRGLIRTLLMSPFLTMSVVSSLLWRNMILDPVYGFFNMMRQMVGLHPVDMVGKHPMLALVLMGVWQWTPFMMLVLSAGLQGIPLEIREAAAIDGAWGINRIRYISLPAIRQHLWVCLLLGTILVLPTFGKIHLTTHGGPGLATTNLAYLVYQQAFQMYEIGTASATALLASLLSLAVGAALIRVFHLSGGAA